MKFNTNSTYEAGPGYEAKILGIFATFMTGIIKTSTGWSATTWSKKGISIDPIGRDLISYWRPELEAESKKSMMLQAGKFYKTKNGNKVKFYEVYDVIIHGAFFSNTRWYPASWRLDGKAYETSNNDIVSEWIDETLFEKVAWINQMGLVEFLSKDNMVTSNYVRAMWLDKPSED